MDDAQVNNKLKRTSKVTFYKKKNPLTSSNIDYKSKKRTY